MGVNLKLERDGDLLYATVRGPFSLEESKKRFLEILDAALRSESNKVVVDGREMTGLPDGPDRFFYGEFAAHSLREHILKGLVGKPPSFAFVLSPPILDPERFGVTVAANRGMRVKAFDNPDEALAWLWTGEPEPPPARE
jgi:hypothetical protein